MIYLAVQAMMGRTKYKTKRKKSLFTIWLEVKSNKTNNSSILSRSKKQNSIEYDLNFKILINEAKKKMVNS